MTGTPAGHQAPGQAPPSLGWPLAAGRSRQLSFLWVRKGHSSVVRVTPRGLWGLSPGPASSAGSQSRPTGRHAAVMRPCKRYSRRTRGVCEEEEVGPPCCRMHGTRPPGRGRGAAVPVEEPRTSEPQNSRRGGRRPLRAELWASGGEAEVPASEPGSLRLRPDRPRTLLTGSQQRWGCPSRCKGAGRRQALGAAERHHLEPGLPAPGCFSSPLPRVAREGRPAPLCASVSPSVNGDGDGTPFCLGVRSLVLPGLTS